MGVLLFHIELFDTVGASVVGRYSMYPILAFYIQSLDIYDVSSGFISNPIQSNPGDVIETSMDRRSSYSDPCFFDARLYSNYVVFRRKVYVIKEH